jgi:peptide/nickel transport system permease protein
MLAFVIRRLLQAVVVLLTVAFIAFTLFQYVGDPVSNLVGQEATPAQRAELRAALGLDQPFFVQFARFAGNAVQGEFGLSLRQGRKVSALIAERLPATLELSLAAGVIALVVGIPMGVYAALRRHSFGAQWLMAVSLLGVSLPTFLIGILLILVFAVLLNWLPSYGRGDVTTIGNWTTGLLTIDGVRHLVLPAVTLAIFQLTLIIRLVRAEMLEVLRTDYIKFAKARGLPSRIVYFRHALRNTLVPVITITGLQIGGLIAFAIITETVFQWPGMGLLFIQAVQFVDIPVMAAYLCLIALIFVLINLVVDLLYFAVDPRLRVERTPAH